MLTFLLKLAIGLVCGSLTATLVAPVFGPLDGGGLLLWLTITIVVAAFVTPSRSIGRAAIRGALTLAAVALLLPAIMARFY